MKTTIDRLTVCGNAFGDVEMLFENSDYVKHSGIAKFPYRHYITFLDGSILQIAEKSLVDSGKIKKLRYEFNPNNKLYEKIHLQVMKMFKDPHATRIDIAFDIEDIDMSDWKWIDSKSRPSNIWYDGHGKIETVYIGGKESELRVRIYDKAKEQKMKDKKWWRVEVQLRGESAETYRQCSRFGKVNINPFEDIVPVKDGDYPHLDIKTRAMIKYLIAYPSGFSELSVNSRTKYKNIMKGLCSWETINLKNAWNEKSSDMGSELESWFSFTHELFL